VFALIAPVGSQCGCDVSRDGFVFYSEYLDNEARLRKIPNTDSTHTQCCGEFRFASPPCQEDRPPAQAPALQ